MIYVTGDCHGNFARFEQKNFPEQAVQGIPILLNLFSPSGKL